MTWHWITVVVVMSALTWMLAVWFVERRLADHERRLAALEQRPVKKP